MLVIIFWGSFFIFLRHFCCFSGLSLVLHLNITANIFYFAANCLVPGAPYQGKTIDQDFRHGRTVRFTCPINYVMEGVAAIKCTDGQWSNNKPSCKGNLTLENRNNVTLRSVFFLLCLQKLANSVPPVVYVVSGKHITPLSLALLLSNKIIGIFVGLGSHRKRPCTLYKGPRHAHNGYQRRLGTCW